MKRFLTLALAGALVLGMGSVAYANICAFDPVPAATLLFPFVTYNYDAGVAANGATTLWSITNVSSDAQIVHVTLWTDYSVAILDFNILLTGYDLQNWNIRDTLRDGKLPATYYADDNEGGTPPDDGPWSARNSLTKSRVTFTGLNDPQPTGVLDCSPSNDFYPGKFATQRIPANILALFQGWLQSSQTADRGYADCDGYLLDPQPPVPTWFESRTTADDTWMYLTMDVVNECNSLFPDSTSYWTTYAEYSNVLVGDYTIVNQDLRFSEVDNAVHLEADPAGFPTAVNPNDDGLPITFYARYANNLPGLSDWREPLPTAWAVRYQNKELADGNMLETYLRVFKANTRTDYRIVPDLFYTLSLTDGTGAVELYSNVCLAYTYYTWDDEENVSTTTGVPWSQPGIGAVVPNLLPLETQEVNAAQFDLVGEDGWMMFIWPASNGALDSSDAPVYYQTWMGVKYQKEGEFSGARDAQVLANYNCFSNEILPGLGIGKYAYAE